jgi:hypothetical protein
LNPNLGRVMALTARQSSFRGDRTAAQVAFLQALSERCEVVLGSLTILDVAVIF